MFSPPHIYRMRPVHMPLPDRAQLQRAVLNAGLQSLTEDSHKKPLHCKTLFRLARGSPAASPTPIDFSTCSVQARSSNGGSVCGCAERHLTTERQTDVFQLLPGGSKRRQQRVGRSSHRRQATAATGCGEEERRRDAKKLNPRRWQRAGRSSHQRSSTQTPKHRTASTAVVRHASGEEYAGGVARQIGDKVHFASHRRRSGGGARWRARRHR